MFSSRNEGMRSMYVFLLSSYTLFNYVNLIQSSTISFLVKNQSEYLFSASLYSIDNAAKKKSKCHPNVPCLRFDHEKLFLFLDSMQTKKIMTLNDQWPRIKALLSFRFCSVRFCHI